MNHEDCKQIEAVLDEKVRPALRAHGGEISVDRLEDGVLYVKLLGQCAGCPSADLTNETLVEAELTAALPSWCGRSPSSRRSATSCGNRPNACCGTTICKFLSLFLYLWEKYAYNK